MRIQTRRLAHLGSDNRRPAMVRDNLTWRGRNGIRIRNGAGGDLKGFACRESGRYESRLETNLALSWDHLKFWN
ncbi:MAG: hypothetical protein AB9866_01690 [Syntrophobacteraceae bacterium]